MSPLGWTNLEGKLGVYLAQVVVRAVRPAMYKTISDLTETTTKHSKRQAMRLHG